MVDPSSGSAGYDFDEAIAVTTTGEGQLRASIAPGWDIRGIPNGGYLLALMTAAGQTAVPQPHPLSVSATYLGPPDFSEADLTVDVARVGRRQSTATVRLHQNGEEKVRATMTFGTLLDADPEILADDAERPLEPRPAASQLVERASTDGEVIALRERVEILLAEGVGFAAGQPSGEARLDAWLRFANGRDPDPLALLLFGDAVPPSIFERRGLGVGHVPTVQLTTHLFALPAPGPVQARFRTRVQGGSFIDEDGELWDANGRLVATARQLALLR
ncbi:MAG: thioesterase family protein [Actinomycetota bacterium]